MAQHLGITSFGVESQAKLKQCIPDVLSWNEKFQVEKPLTKTQELRALFQGENNFE
jgi:hypothetical protein